MTSSDEILDVHQVRTYLRKNGIVSCLMVRASLTGRQLVIYIDALSGQMGDTEELLRVITDNVEAVSPGILTCDREPRPGAQERL